MEAAPEIPQVVNLNVLIDQGSIVCNGTDFHDLYANCYTPKIQYTSRPYWNDGYVSYGGGNGTGEYSTILPGYNKINAFSTVISGQPNRSISWNSIMEMSIFEANYTSGAISLYVQSSGNFYMSLVVNLSE